MDWLTELTTLLGVNPFVFLAASGLIVLILAVVRYFLGKETLEKKRWWKIVLTLASLGMGIGLAFLFEGGGLYRASNVYLVIVTGLFNGAIAVAGHQLLKQIPWLEKFLRGTSSVLVAALLLTGCGSWLTTTRTTLLATNAGLNGYDDVAVGVWQDAPTNPESKEDLGTSLCASVITQDAIVQAWSITTAVAHGQAKKTDITPYVSTILTVLDSLEDYLEMGGYPIPTELKGAISYLERNNPGAIIDPELDPLEDCTAVLEERFPTAGLGNVPWDTIISTGAEFALFLMEIIRSAKEGEEIPDDALNAHIRDVLKQAVLYEKTLGD